MIIKALVENTSISENLSTEHGLSLYIETKNHKLLFDLGASNLFVENAKKLNVNLSDVDSVIISHGHYDHGGGLKTFLNLNKKAKIYLNERAFEKHYANRAGGVKADIGLDESLASNKRIILVGDYLKIDDELELFSHITGRQMYPSGNSNLLMKNGSDFEPDSFVHEQNLLITEGEKEVLIAGCAHNGIVNIIEHVAKRKNQVPSHVIGGFHLHNPSTDADEDPEKVQEIGEYFKNTNSVFYTCHCTGIKSYSHLKEIMGERMGYVATGDEIYI